MSSPAKLFLPPITPAAPGALWDQIVVGMRREISEGRLRPGVGLPSFRQLATDLMVSVITVKRAYEELEREGLIFRKQGLGTFVAEDGGAKGREAKLAHARELIGQAAQEAMEGGIERGALGKFLQETLLHLTKP